MFKILNSTHFHCICMRYFSLFFSLCFFLSFSHISVTIPHSFPPYLPPTFLVFCICYYMPLCLLTLIILLLFIMLLFTGLQLRRVNNYYNKEKMKNNFDDNDKWHLYNSYHKGASQNKGYKILFIACIYMIYVECLIPLSQNTRHFSIAALYIIVHFSSGKLWMHR